MILAAHDLRCHIARRTGRIRRVFGAQNLRNTHICDSHVAILLHNYVFRLYVPMDHALIVHVLQTKHHASDHKLGLRLSEAPANPNVVP